MGPTGHLVTIKRSGVDGAHFPLSLSTCWFGRGIECDIRIQLPVVSKQHCKIEVSQQKATLINFSSSNPTLLNGVAIEHPVLLQHGDMITIVDRSFRYEDASHQDGSSSTTREGRSCPEESLRRLSASRSSLGLDGTVPEPKGRPGGPEEKVLEHETSSRGAARRSLERGTGRRTTDGIQALEPGRAPAAGTWPRTLRPEKGRTSLSPSQQLYKSMKEDLDARAEKENVPQGPQQKSGTQKLQGKPPTPVSGGSRRKSSMGGVHLQATPLPGEQTLTPKEQQSPRGHPISYSCSRPGTPNAKHPGQPAASPQTASRKRQRHSEDLGSDGGRGSPGRGQTPTKTQHACPRDTPEKPLSKKRRRLSATDILAPDTATQNPSVLAPLFMQGFGDTPQAPCTLPEKAAVAAGQGSPGLGSVGVSSCNHLAKWTVEEPGKRRRVSFGGRLRPELFDENLPPNTPLKRGETPKRRQSATPAVLKKIIKGQPQTFPGPEAASSDVLATPPTASSGQSSPSALRSSRRSTTGTPRQSAGNTPGRTSRRRSSTGRGQQNLLHLIYSKRRSGASGANLMVAKSWADVVKLGAKPTQARVARRTAPTQPQRKRKRIQNTPKKPVEAPHPFSTGHANSPCTITVGRAQLQKLRVPARPHRIFDHLVLGHKAGLPEDLSGLAEMFQTPGKPGPRRKSVGPTRLSESKVLLAGKLSSPCSKEVPLPVAEDTAVDATSQACGAESASPKPLLRRGTAELTDGTRKTPPGRRSQQLQEELCSMAEDQELTTATALLVRAPGPQTSLTPGYGDAEQGPILHLEPEGIARRRSRRTETREPRDDTTTLVSPQEEVRGLKPLCMGPTKGTESTEHQACGAYCPSPNTEPRDTPTYINRKSKTSSQAIREPPASRRSPHTSAKTTPTCKGPISDVEKARFLLETPKQDVDTKDSHRGSRRRSRTPKRNTLNDLTGFKELFQTPEQIKEQGTESQTTLLCLSPKSEIGDTPLNTNRKSKTPSRTVGESPTPRRTSHTPARATPTCKGPTSDVGKVGFLQETPKQDMDSEDSAQGNRRRPKTPRRNSLGDLTGFKELFQTPELAKGSETQSQATAPCLSPKSEKEDTPTNIKRKSKTPSQDVGESPTTKKTPLIPRRRTPTCKGPTSDVGKVGFLQETPKQDMDSEDSAQGNRRRAKTPRRNSLGDLTGFKELFQTPELAKGSETQSQATAPCPSPKSEKEDTPTNIKRKSKTPSQDVGESPTTKKTPLIPRRRTPTCKGPTSDIGKVGFLQETPKQDMDSEDSAQGNRRRAKTPRRNSLGDLTGFKELFQTPELAKGSETQSQAIAPCPSPKSEKEDTPTNNKRKSKTPSQDVGESPTAKKTPHISRRSTPTCKGPTSGTGKANSLQETPKQAPGPAEGGSVKGPRTPKVKMQIPKDMTGFQELFWTPEPTQGPKPEAKPCSAPKVELTGTSSTKRGSKTPSWAMWETSVPRKTSLTSGRVTPTQGEPVVQDRGVTAPQEVTEQDIRGSRRRPGTPKVRAKSLGNLMDLKELFQTPEQAKGQRVESPATAPCSSLKAEPGDALRNTSRKSKTPLTLGWATPQHTGPANETGKAKLLQETLKQSPSLAKGRSARVLRTPRVKGQSIEDMTGIQELFWTPEPAQAPKSETRPCLTPKAEPTDTPSINRVPTTPSQDGEKTPAPRRNPITSKRATPACKEPTSDVEKVGFLQETPKQDVDAKDNARGSRRRSRTPKRNTLDDLTGFKELFQTPEQAKGPKVESQATAPCLSPKAEPRDALTGSSRKSKTLSRGVVEPPAARTPLTLEKAIPEHTGPAGDEAKAKLLQETQKQALGPADNAQGNRRQPRTPKVKAQPLEDLTGFKELFQTPEQAKGWRIESQATAPCPSSKADPGDALTDTKTPSRGTGELPTARRTPLTLGRATPKHTGPASDMGTVRSLQETLKQAQGLVDDAQGSRRHPGTPKVMSEDLEDLTGLRELFQSPEPTVGPIYAMETSLEPHETPQVDSILAPRRVRQPREPAIPGEGLPSHPSTQGSRRATRTGGQLVGRGKGSEPLQKGSEECSELPESLSRSRRQLRAARTGLRALSSSAEQGEGPTPQEETQSAAPKNSRMVRPSLLPKPAQVATGRTRWLQTPAEPSACSRPTRAATSRAMRGDQADPADSTLDIQGSAGQKLEPAESKTGARRQLRAARVKAGDPGTSENPAGLQELAPLRDAQKSDSTSEPRVIHRSSPAPTVPTTSRTRRRQALTGPGPQEKLSNHRQPTQAVVTRTRRGEQANPAEITGGPAEQKLEPVESKTGTRRQLRAARAKAQDSGASENPAKLQEPSPLRDTGDPDSAAEPRIIHGSSPAPTVPTTSRTRRRQAPAGPDSQEQPSDRRRPTRAIVSKAMRGGQANPADSTVAPQEPTGQKLEPAESETGGRRHLRATRAKARVLGDPVGLKEPFNISTDIEVFRPEDRPSEEPPTATQPEPEPVIPSSKRRRLRAPVGTEGRDEEPPAPGRATRATRGAMKVPSNQGIGEDGSDEQMLDMAGVTGGKRQRRAQARGPGVETEASLRVRFELPQLAQMSPGMKRPTRTFRRGIQGPPKGSAQSGLSVSPRPPVRSPLREGGVTRGKRQRPNTPARAVEDNKPAEKRRRTALEPVTTVKSQRVRAQKGNPADQSPSVQEQAKSTPVGGKDEQGTLHPRRPIEVAAMPEPESLEPAEKTRAKRDRRPLVDASQGPEPRGAAPKDTRIPESRAALRSARSKSTLPPRAAKESQDEGDPRKTALRPRKKLLAPVPPDNVDQDPRPRATRSTKRGDDNEKENSSVQDKKLCLRSMRKQAAV
ncbi:proliferation marker protein Ki-67 [Suncus etruscus]|uniref:proliferation marker protein Ki-67 n=1 Tax=Suncus etruscus TaxID=109475 RepID=UPI00210FA546|nr:proliferation marker protein Ki-67 [Suncus etruscus]